MTASVKARLEKLVAGIKSHPDLHTKTFSFGARVYDMMDLIDGKAYYFRVAFDVHPQTKVVVILNMVVVEVHGPH
jgi:hypothetical protein